MCNQTITARYKVTSTHPQFCTRGELHVQGQMNLYACTVRIPVVMLLALQALLLPLLLRKACCVLGFSKRLFKLLKGGASSCKIHP